MSRPLNVEKEIFSNFCNICWTKATKDFKLISNNTNQHYKNILIGLVGYDQIVNKSLIYLCPSCCEELNGFNNFKRKCVNQFLDLRQMYFEIKNNLPEVQEKEVVNNLKSFILTKVVNNKVKNNRKVPENVQISRENLNQVFEVDECSEKEFSEKTTDGVIDISDMIIKQEKLDTEFNTNIEQKVSLQCDEIYICDDEKEVLNVEPLIKREIGSGESCKLDEKTDTDVLDVGVIENANNRRSQYTSIQNAESVNQVFKCKICLIAFKTLRNLKDHEISHEEKNEITCDLCDITFHRSSDLDRHMLVHGGSRPYQCRVCKRSFAVRTYLKRHERTHNGAFSHECELCKETFSNFELLNCHKKKVHPNAKLHECKICHKVFGKASYMLVHERIHSGEKPYRCSLCGKCFAQSYTLIVHQRRHKGVKPYQCFGCNKNFTTSSDLSRHEMIHSQRPRKTKVK